jgi:hypothetical protein
MNTATYLMVTLLFTVIRKYISLTFCFVFKAVELATPKGLKIIAGVIHITWSDSARIL